MLTISISGAAHASVADDGDYFAFIGALITVAFRNGYDELTNAQSGEILAPIADALRTNSGIIIPENTNNALRICGRSKRISRFNPGSDDKATKPERLTRYLTELTEAFRLALAYYTPTTIIGHSPGGFAYKSNQAETSAAIAAFLCVDHASNAHYATRYAIPHLITLENLTPSAP